ncbi:MAG: CotH kinase family protein, partial [Ignavibacteriae bacterium]|nr:CotH kinase family protein [Ignavibacteriota bacterium]
MKKLSTFCFLLLLLVKNGYSQQVVLNEIQSSNWGIVSSGGKLEDWIELKNLTGNALNMSKFYLSNDRRNLTKWKFPSSVIIQANSLLVVFASGNNRIISGKPHTNFSLSSYSSEIFLSDSNGNLVDMHEASGITSKTSWARVPDGGSNWCILGIPTPGGTNGNGSCITEYAPVPVVSVAPGIYSSRQYVTITCPDSGTFKYTIDGSSVGTTAKTIGPKNSGTTIQIDSSCVLKIKAYKTGKHASREWVGTYLTKQPTITMPIISVSLNPDSFSYLYSANDHDNEKAGYVEYMDKNGKVLNRFGANFTIHGNASSSFVQKSLRIETRQWLDSSNVDYQFFPKKISKFRNFNLKNAGVDWMSRHVTDLANALITRETNVDCADGRFVLGYMNGKYYGVFDLREKIDNDFVAENHDVNPDSIDMLSYSGTVNYGKDSAWNALSSMVNSLNLSVDSNFAKVAKYIDLDNWIDYFTTETYIANTDWPGNNIKWWRPQRKDGKWRYILWDTDFGWGMFWSGNTVDHNSLPSALGGGLLISKLMDNIAFRKKFINRYADLINTTFRYENLAGANNPYNVFKNLFTIMDKEMPRAFTRWSGSTQSASYTDWKTAYGNMQVWARDRPKNARMHMKDQYSSMISDTVSLTFQVSPTGAGTIKVNTIYPNIGTGWKGTYYKGVEITVTAIPNPGYEFTSWNINNNDSNSTTTKNFTATGAVIASFTQTDTIEQPKLAFTEINYNSNNTLNAGNWIELKNYGQSTVDMSGWVLETKTIWKKYKFPDGFKIKSGEYIIL